MCANTAISAFFSSLKLVSFLHFGSISYLLTFHLCFIILFRSITLVNFYSIYFFVFNVRSNFFYQWLGSLKQHSLVLLFFRALSVLFSTNDFLFWWKMPFLTKCVRGLFPSQRIFTTIGYACLPLSLPVFVH